MGQEDLPSAPKDIPPSAQEILDSIDWETEAPHIYQRVSEKCSQKSGQPVECGPDTDYCWNTADEVIEILGEKGIKRARVLQGGDDSNRESSGHYFAFVPNDHNPWLGTIIDPQYKQYVAEEDRSGLPNVMVLPFSSKDELIEGLHRHRVIVGCMDSWTEGIYFG